MTVDELIACIIAAYPGASLEATLGQAATEVLATFRPKYGQPFPIPADFEAVLPKQRRDIARAAPIDAGRHAERKRRLMAEWRRSVGAAVPEVKRALETIAFEVADAAAWRETGKPIALSDKQRRLAEQRAISLQRCVEFGPVFQVSTETWCAQISAIAARWNVATSLEEWGPGEWRA